MDNYKVMVEPDEIVVSQVNIAPAGGWAWHNTAFIRRCDSGAENAAFNGVWTMFSGGAGWNAWVALAHEIIREDIRLRAREVE